MASNAWRIVALLALLALLTTSSGFAQEVAPANAAAPQQVPIADPGVPTLGDLDRIQSEIIMTQARLQLIQAQESLAKARGTTLQGASVVTPVVAGVFGTQAQPYARFLLGDGAEAIGRPGDVLPGEFRVVHVGVDKVVIKDRKGRTIMARFSSSAPAPAPAAAQPQSTPPNAPPAVSGG